MKLKLILNYLKKRPGFIFLILILLIINIATLKPQFYLLGWDNYSSYFNIKTNIFRTLFSSWREYRGLGVPSDSEVVDLPRQLLFLILSPFVKEGLLDQIYIVFCLNMGIIGLYFFTRKLLSYIFKDNKAKNLDLISFISSFFYLFNLDTLATLFFPMIMYINRFASLPLLFYIFLVLLTENKIRLKHYILIVFIIFFISGSFLTATIFITFLLTLLIFQLFFGQLKQKIMLFIFFLGLNFFWLLPFYNYTVQNSKIIRLAPTFINANEIQLNKPSSFFNLDKLFTLYPNFFYTNIVKISDNLSQPLHPLVPLYNSPQGKIVLFIFPVLYLLGCLLIIFKYKKKSLFWIPIIIFISLFLVGKEYTPLGFIYHTLSKLTPYFDVIFRFADTKFNIFISFCGSLAAGIVFLFLTDFLSNNRLKIQKLKYLAVLILCLPTIYIFKTFLNGQLIGLFMYNKIPNAYFQITKFINQDSQDFRVLHLPFSETGYWKSYTWGLSGSSFLHFMLDKPLIDRTFEPASRENEYLHKHIFSLIENSQEAVNEEQLYNKAFKLYQLLNKTGVKYIILDETVSKAVYSKGVYYWGDFNGIDSQNILSTLITAKLVEKVAEYDVNILDFLNIYPYSSKLNAETRSKLLKNPIYKIKLFKLKNFSPKIKILKTAYNLDPNFTNLLASNIVLNNENYLQNTNIEADIIYPFQKTNTNLKESGKSYVLDLNLKPTSLKQYYIQDGKNIYSKNKNMVDIYAKLNEENLIISFYNLPIPIIQGKKTTKLVGEIQIPIETIKQALNVPESNIDNYLADWHVLNIETVGNLRLSLNNITLPLPTNLTSNSTFIGSIILDKNQHNFKLLVKDNSQTLNPADFKLTDNPNCFADKLEDYEFHLADNENQLNLKTKNGSTCFFADLQKYINSDTDHLEINFDIKSSNKDLDQLYLKNNIKTSKSLLFKFLSNQTKPNYLNICLKEPLTDMCFNKHQVLGLKDRQNIIVPLNKPANLIYQPLLLLSLKNLGYQEQEITLNSIILNKYKSVFNQDLSLNFDSANYSLNLNTDQNLTVEIPIAVSADSFYLNKKIDSFYLSNQPCAQEENSYRSFRIINNNLIGSVINCYNQSFIPVNFNSNNFYLWKVDYHLFSGKYPKFILDDGFHSYLDQYFSIDQGYPDIPYFKSLQQPENILNKLNSNAYLKKLDQKFLNTIFQPTYTFIPSQPEIADSKPKEFTIHQDSENEGIFSLSSFNILELPSSWQNLAIKSNNQSKNYSQNSQLKYVKILPSLYKVSINRDNNSLPTLLSFNESYSNQWKLYKNIPDLILGKSLKDVKHYKLNGYANAWEIPTDQLKNEDSFYIFYLPEKLSFIGWITSFLTVLIFVKILVKKPRKVLN